MLATKLYPLLPTTPGTANLTNFPKRKTPQSATFQSLYINKNERTLFPRFVVVGFLYSFCSSRQDFQIFFAHTVKHFADDEAEQSFVVGGKEITAKLLAEALHSLPEEKRETVLLYYFFDMSEREIAKFCNLSRTTVQSRRTSSMKLLKRYLEEKAYDCTD